MGQLESLIQDLNLHGADLWHHVHARVGQPQLSKLIEKKVLRDLETPFGLAIVLGSTGRKLVKKDSAYKVNPYTAASSVLRRMVRLNLEQQGWQFVKYVDPRQNLMLLVQQENIIMVCAHHFDLSPSTLEFYVEKFLYGKPQIRLLFTAQNPKSYKAVLEKYPQLKLLKVDLVLPPFSL